MAQQQQMNINQPINNLLAQWRKEAQSEALVWLTQHFYYIKANAALPELRQRLADVTAEIEQVEADDLPRLERAAGNAKEKHDKLYHSLRPWERGQNRELTDLKAAFDSSSSDYTRAQTRLQRLQQEAEQLRGKISTIEGIEKPKEIELW